MQPSSYAAARSWAPHAICQQFYKSQNRNLPIKSIQRSMYPVVCLMIHLMLQLPDLGHSMPPTSTKRTASRTAEYAQGWRNMVVMDAKGWCFLFQNFEEMKGRMKNFIVWSTSTSYGRLTSISDLPVYGKLAKCWTREPRSRPSCCAESVIFLSFFRCTLFNIFGIICATLVMASSFCGSFPCL